MQFEGLSLLIATITLVALSIFIILLFLLFQKRKNTLILHQKEAEKRFEQELSTTKIEIREETFRNISWELHDNIGQLLTLAKIQIQNDVDRSEIKETINKGLEELRSLSRIINPDKIKSMTLVETIHQEVERYKRLNFIEASLSIDGEERQLESNSETILFRILQEFFSNTIKHAKATHLDIILNFKADELVIIAKDNGLGFNTEEKNKKGIGLINIKNRAKLINADLVITSAINEGTQLKLVYKYQTNE